MNKDSNFTQVHMRESQHSDLFEDFCKDRLPDDEIYVPPHLQPMNPEDEDGMVPDQHAAFGIQKATQRVREPAWKDLGLEALMARKRDHVGTGAGGGRGPGGFKGLPR